MPAFPYLERIIKIYLFLSINSSHTWSLSLGLEDGGDAMDINKRPCQAIRWT